MVARRKRRAERNAESEIRKGLTQRRKDAKGVQSKTMRPLTTDHGPVKQGMRPETGDRKGKRRAPCARSQAKGTRQIHGPKAYGRATMGKVSVKSEKNARKILVLYILIQTTNRVKASRKDYQPRNTETRKRKVRAKTEMLKPARGDTRPTSLPTG